MCNNKYAESSRCLDEWKADQEYYVCVNEFRHHFWTLMRFLSDGRELPAEKQSNLFQKGLAHVIFVSLSVCFSLCVFFAWLLPVEVAG